jgi:hypothetical protein
VFEAALLCEVLPGIERCVAAANSLLQFPLSDRCIKYGTMIYHCCPLASFKLVCYFRSAHHNFTNQPKGLIHD